MRLVQGDFLCFFVVLVNKTKTGNLRDCFLVFVYCWVESWRYFMFLALLFIVFVFVYQRDICCCRRRRRLEGLTVYMSVGGTVAP